jgi:putative ABC transport system permease protein
MQTILQDLRYGARMLLKSPGFTALAVITLALGIGANTAIFSAADALLLRQLPYPDPDRLVMIWENDTQEGNPRNPVAPANFVDWRKQNEVCSQIGYFAQPSGLNLTGGEEPERITGIFVSQNLFSLLGVQPRLGRGFLAEDLKERQGLVVLLSYGLWERRFGSDPSVIGKPLTLDGAAFTVIGVMPPNFQLPEQADLWGMTQNGELASMRGQHFLRVMARLKPGVALEQARTSFALIARQLEQQYPDTNKGYGVNVLPLRDQVVGDAKLTLWILMGAVGFVLAVACANVANLMLARGSVRQREMAIRSAIGASRFRLIRQLLTESILLALVGGALGLLLASWSVGWVSGLGANVTLAPKIEVDLRALGFTLLITTLTGILFGSAPALVASRPIWPTLSDALKEGASSASSSSTRIRNLLVITEIALALALLSGAGLMIRSLIRLRNVETGFDPRNMLTMQFDPSGEKYDEGEKVAAFYVQLIERAQSMPGVISAAVISRIPLAGDRSTSGLTIEGRPAAPGEQREVHFRVVTPGYFRTMRIPLSAGREMTGQDGQKTERVALVNQTMARKYWPGDDAIGKRIKLGPNANSPWVSIVGVVGDVRNFGLENEALPEAYVPILQSPSSRMRLVVKTAVEPLSLVSTVKEAVRSLDRDIPFSQVATMEQLLAKSVAQRRLNLSLLGVFAVIALVLAASGIYGVMNYAVSMRTREIGVRLALGAQSSDILRLVVEQGMRLALAGVGFGIISSLALTRLMTTLLYGISAADPLTFIAVTALLVIVTLVACWIPARRATKVDPMAALRFE